MNWRKLESTSQKHDARFAIIFGSTGGLIATAAGGIFSWVFYDASNSISQAPTIAITAGLALTLGLAAPRVTRWLTGKDSRKPKPPSSRIIFALLPPADTRLRKCIRNGSNGPAAPHHGERQVR